jgi:hypothetical protein
MVIYIYYRIRSRRTIIFANCSLIFCFKFLKNFKHGKIAARTRKIVFLLRIQKPKHVQNQLLNTLTATVEEFTRPKEKEEEED